MNSSELAAKNNGQTVIILTNPTAGASSGALIVGEVKLALEARGFSVLVIAKIDEAAECAKKLFHSGSLRTVVAAGGDGTLALLANHLPPEIPLTMLPLGTENLLAKYFGLTNNIQEVAGIVADGQVLQVDSGVANGKRFLLMASCGFDADVVTRMHQQRTGHIQRSSYAKPIWKSIRKYKYPELLVYPDDYETPIKARWAFMFNFPCYAMGLPIIPWADATDGQFDLCTFRGGNLFNGLIYLAGILLRRHRGWRDTHFENFSRLRIESNGEVPYQLDGDPGGKLPLEISVVPHGLTILLPKNHALRKNPVENPSEQNVNV